MAVLPTTPPTYRASDVEGTVRSLCSYSSTTHEYLEYLISQLKTRVSDLETAGSNLQTE